MEIIWSIKNKQAGLSLPHHACKSSSVQKQRELPPQAAHMRGWGAPDQRQTLGHTARLLQEDGGEETRSQRDPSSAWEKRG